MFSARTKPPPGPWPERSILWFLFIDPASNHRVLSITLKIRWNHCGFSISRLWCGSLNQIISHDQLCGLFCKLLQITWQGWVRRNSFPGFTFHCLQCITCDIKTEGPVYQKANAIIQYWWHTTLFVLTLNMTHIKQIFYRTAFYSDNKEFLAAVLESAHIPHSGQTLSWKKFFQVNCCIKLHFDNWAGAAAGNKHPTCCQTILCCWNCISRKLDILSDLCQKVKISRNNHQASKKIFLPNNQLEQSGLLAVSNSWPPES